MSIFLNHCEFWKNNIAVEELIRLAFLNWINQLFSKLHSPASWIRDFSDTRSVIFCFQEVTYRRNGRNVMSRYYVLPFFENPRETVSLFWKIRNKIDRTLRNFNFMDFLFHSDLKFELFETFINQKILT
jgi:hypothetical protein